MCLKLVNITFKYIILYSIVMAQWHLHSRTKTTGGLLKRHSKKHKHQRGRDFLPAKIGEQKVSHLRVRGGNKKLIVLSANTANIMINGKAKKAKFTSVIENKADSQFVRRNIITKNAVILTELGKARVTSRPGQDGVINAVLI